MGGAFDGGGREGRFEGHAEQPFGGAGAELFEEAGGEFGESAELFGLAGAGEQRGDELVEVERAEGFGEFLLLFAFENSAAEQFAEQAVELAFEGGEQAGDVDEFADRGGGAELCDGVGEVFFEAGEPELFVSEQPDLEVGEDADVFEAGEIFGELGGAEVAEREAGEQFFDLAG